MPEGPFAAEYCFSDVLQHALLRVGSRLRDSWCLTSLADWTVAPQGQWCRCDPSGFTQRFGTCWGDQESPPALCPLSTGRAELRLPCPAPTHGSSPPKPQMLGGSSPSPQDFTMLPDCSYPACVAGRVLPVGRRMSWWSKNALCFWRACLFLLSIFQCSDNACVW